ncbi:MAG TPA: hypothetical protein VHT26_07660 [Trebonia sp.]|jgi:hypothetical protein|nr:hypothetical protein [Trebonia sp.]
MPVYTPPDRPSVSPNPVVDVQRAYEWTAEFFAVRAPVIRLIGDVVRAGIARVG